MLDIVASYHFMQLQGKLIKLTEENGKKTYFRPDFCSFGPKFWPTTFFLFSKIWLLQSLDIMVSYHHVQSQKQLMIQS